MSSKRQIHRTIYTIIGLLISFGILVSTALLVPPAWWKGRSPGPNSNTAPPITNPQVKKQPEVCGVWVSETSEKKYSFVCKDQNSFQIDEVNFNGHTNSGSGSFTDGGHINADLFIPKRSRMAHLRLQLSSDGKRIDGTWVGDDPANESGIVAFHRAESGE